MKNKEVMGVVLFGILIIAILMFGMNRIEKINNGDMTLVSQNEIDR